MVKVKKKWEDLDKEEFKENEITTRINLSGEDKKNPSGIFINTEKKLSENYTKRHKGVWLPKNLNLGRWLDKLAEIIKKLAKKWYKEEVVVSQENILKQVDKVKKLEQELLEEKQKGKRLEENYKEQQINLELAKEVVDNLNSYETKLKTFEDMIKISVNEDNNIEGKIQNFIFENRWIIGLDCEVRAKNIDIDKQTEIDLHIINHFGQHRIVEIKSPNKKLFKKKREQGRLIITSDLSEALSELIVYMKKADFYSGLKEEGTHKINKPSGIILMDYNLNEVEKSMLNTLNSHLKPHIMIITYNDLIENGNKEISMIKNVK